MIALLLGVLAAGTVAKPIHSVADLTCPEGVVACRLTVPDWVYRVQSPAGTAMEWRPRTLDGVALPWRLLPAPAQVSDTSSLALPFLVATPQGGAVSATRRLDVRGLEGRFSLRLESSDPIEATKNVSWMVDVRGHRFEALSLLVGERDFLGEMDVEASDDLVHWNSWSRAQAVARLDSAGFRARLLEIPVSDSTAFVRLSYHGLQGALEFKGVNGRIRTRRDGARDTTVQAAATTSDDSGWSWDLGGRFPSTGALVQLQSDGAWGEVVLETRDGPSDRWLAVARQTCWRWSRQSHVFGQDTLGWDPALRSRYWRVRPLGPAVTLGAAPRLWIRVRPDRIEVATGGNPRLSLAAGWSPRGEAPAPGLEQALPGGVGEGVVGVPRKAAGEAAWAVESSKRPWVLWGALVAFLAVLAAMATKLLRETFGAAKN